METENSPKHISEREATVLPSQTVSNSTDVQIENGPTPVSEPKLDKSASEPMEVNAEATNVGAETTSVEVESTNSKVEPKTNQEAVVENGCMDTSTSSPTESEHPKNKQPAIPVWEALTKDCFSFNTKVKLGDFIELQQGEKVQYVTLTDEQRDKRIQTADAKRDKQLEKAQKAKMKKQHAKDLIKQKEIADADKRKRQIELAQKAVEEKLKKQMEKAKQRAQHELIKQQKALAQAMRKHALQAARDKDKMQKQAKAREILEERRKRQRDFKEAKARERMEKAMVKEKRRQLLMNSRLHEARKKEEERCRLHIERLLAKERRTELKRKELELIKSMKDPAEDLQLPGTKGLPAYSRITGLKLSGGAFADVLQAHQFITNFYDCLEFKQTIPTLDVFQQALLHDSERSESQLTNILCHMLQFAMKDPGVPNPKKFKNELEQNLLSCIIDEYSFTEIFRNFIIARTGGRGNEISEELQIKPFDSLSVGQRAHAIAWLCDELVTSKAVTEEIDSNMEDISGLKRDKWELEGKIREMRVVQDKVTRRDEEIRKVQTGSDAESDQENSRQLSSSVEGHGSVEEVDKKVEKMTKQHRKLCREVRRCAGTLRTLPFGMDRYRRYYWSLPSFKGTLVESKESSLSEAFGSPDDYAVTDAQPNPVKVKSDEKSVEGAAEMNGNAMDTNENDVKDEVKSDVKAEEGRTPGGIKKESSQLDSSQTAEPPNLSSTPSQPPRVNGAVGGHSITSWLNSTIDSIFEASIKSSPSSDLKPTTTTSLNTHSQLSADGSICATEEPCWFDLKKRIACSSISTCNPDTVSSSLAFPNNAAMTCYEDQQALDSYNKVAAKCALLEKPVEIPTDLQRGWWVITDFGEMRTLNGTLHQRGIRERILSRTLQKHSEQVEEAFSDSCMSKDIGLEVDSRDKQISQNPFCAPMADRNWNVQQCRDWELRILDRVEDLEERIYQGSMYTKNWEEGKRHDPNDLDLVITPMEEVSGQQKRIIDLVKEKLLQLESGIERRYLKPPFTKSHHLQLSDITSQEEKKNDESDEEEVEDKNRGLIQWQRAVRMAMNLSQLYLCLQQLENCVAWERSVMRVLCQICRSDDDEDQLLLCDSCDKGYHTYCFKPRMVNIPEGNWYCWECKSKATSVSHCVRCGKTTGKIAVCHKCPQAIHLECMKPAMQRMPRKYTCGHCSSLQNGGTLNRSKRKGKTVNYQDEKEDGSEVENSASGSEDSAETEEDNGLNECSNILSELEKHKDAVPFMQPVDTKAFPQYKKYIKQPMDLGTIRQKLQDNEYKNRSEFYDDVILVFDNCLMFNEDDSSVGKSGKTIRRQFLKRWKQIQ